MKNTAQTLLLFQKIQNSRAHTCRTYCVRAKCLAPSSPLCIMSNLYLTSSPAPAKLSWMDVLTPIVQTSFTATMANFKLYLPFQPAGDQPVAIAKLEKGLEK